MAHARLSVGIDLGIKELATVSNFDSPFRNINKTQRVRKLKKRLKRLQRQVSRKYEKNRQVTNAIAKTKPSRIVMEGLNVTGMLKNKHLSSKSNNRTYHE